MPPGFEGRVDSAWGGEGISPWRGVHRKNHADTQVNVLCRIHGRSEAEEIAGEGWEVGLAGDSLLSGHLTGSLHA